MVNALAVFADRGDDEAGPLALLAFASREPGIVVEENLRPQLGVAGLGDHDMDMGRHVGACVAGRADGPEDKLPVPVGLEIAKEPGMIRVDTIAGDVGGPVGIPALRTRVIRVEERARYRLAAYSPDHALDVQRVAWFVG